MSKYLPQLLIRPNFKLIGHRGVKNLAPENTMMGFNLTKEIGLNWIELDTRITKDEKWVVLHDATIDRTTNGKGLLIEKNFQEITSLDAGSWFDKNITSQKIPTLQEVVNFSFEEEIFLNIEVKMEPHAKFKPKYQAQLFAKFIDDNYPDIYPKPLVSSFNLEFLETLRQFQPKIPIGYLVEKINKNIIETMKKNQFTAINCYVKKAEKQDIELAIKNHFPVFVFTVNDKETADKLIEWGVSGIFTDSPHQLNDTVSQNLKLKQNFA